MLWLGILVFVASLWLTVCWYQYHNEQKLYHTGMVECQKLQPVSWQADMQLQQVALSSDSLARQAEAIEEQWFAEQMKRTGWLLEKLQDELEKLSLTDEDLHNILHEVRQGVQELRNVIVTPLLITILGEFSAGKSTFINALLGEKLLATKVRPTTATITRLQYGQKPCICVKYQDGNSKKFLLDKAKLHDFTAMHLGKEEEDAAREEHLKKIFYVQVDVEHPLLQRFDIADTPGFNSGLEWHSNVTKGFLGVSDVVIWLFDARKAGTQTEANILKEHCDGVRHILGVVNKIDCVHLAPGETWEQHFSALRDDLPDITMENVFFVSAKQAMAGVGTPEYEQSCMQTVTDYLLGHIAANSRFYKLDSVLTKMEAMIVQLSKICEELLAQIHTAEEKITDTETKIQGEAAYKQAIEQGIERWNEDADNKYLAELLRSLARYFTPAYLTADLTQQAEQLLNLYSDLQRQEERLTQRHLQIESEKQTLDNDWQTLMAMQAQYKGGLKEIADDIFNFFTGKTLSAEKERINAYSDKWNSAAEQYNQNIADFNQRLSAWQDGVNGFEEDAVWFFQEKVVLQLQRAEDEAFRLGEVIKQKVELLEEFKQRHTLLMQTVKKIKQDVYDALLPVVISNRIERNVGEFHVRLKCGMEKLRHLQQVTDRWNAGIQEDLQASLQQTLQLMEQEEKLFTDRRRQAADNLLLRIGKWEQLVSILSEQQQALAEQKEMIVQLVGSQQGGIARQYGLWRWLSGAAWRNNTEREQINTGYRALQEYNASIQGFNLQAEKARQVYQQLKQEIYQFLQDTMPSAFGEAEKKISGELQQLQVLLPIVKQLEITQQDVKNETLRKNLQLVRQLATGLGQAELLDYSSLLEGFDAACKMCSEYAKAAPETMRFYSRQQIESINLSMKKGKHMYDGLERERKAAQKIK